MSKLVILHLSPELLSQFSDLPTALNEVSSQRKKPGPKPKQKALPLAHPTPTKADNSILSSPIKSESPYDANTGTSATATKKRGIRRPNALASSPAPTPLMTPTGENTPSRTDTPLNNSGKNSGPTTGGGGSASGGLRVGGLTMNSNSDVELDRSGKPCRKWVKGSRNIKSFSGYDVGFGLWKRLAADGTIERDVVPTANVKQEELKEVDISGIESSVASPFAIDV
ncbi:hypothetical protein CANARDRAFT_21117 [[Candida] arabinofermentans NRRL YB-2248]|uniref:INO80 complex subunit Ies4 n=1 Tax=[Candida] arabinofermentans NRRL YB-2248 TaxID=983967 RepID=A0A1E4T5X7_9ASCO|nr:hypothetical protein CANARDRAFT_21117 [[Candida] arabinofermentans NRRL YB-2248]